MTVREVFLQVRGEPDAKRHPLSVEFPGGRVPHPRKQGKALSGLSRGKVGSELVEVVGGAAPRRLPRPPISVCS